MTEDDDRWRRGKIKGTFNEKGADQRPDKPGLSREFNKQDLERIVGSNVKRLSGEYEKTADLLNRSSKLTPKHQPGGKMRALRNSVNQKEQGRQEKKVKSRMKEIQKQIREQEKRLKRGRGR